MAITRDLAHAEFVDRRFGTAEIVAVVLISAIVVPAAIAAFAWCAHLHKTGYGIAVVMVAIFVSVGLRSLLRRVLLMRYRVVIEKQNLVLVASKGGAETRIPWSSIQTLQYGMFESKGTFGIGAGAHTAFDVTSTTQPRPLLLMAENTLVLDLVRQLADTERENPNITATIT
jgi:hypothetical protein